MKSPTLLDSTLLIGSLLASCGQSGEVTLPESEISLPLNVATESIDQASESAGKEVKIPSWDAPGTLEFARYLDLHRAANDPSAPGWSQALEELVGAGDDFSLVHLAGLKGDSLSAEQREQLDQTIESLRESQGGSEPWTLEATLLTLERSAYADCVCHTMERTLPKWARTQAQEQLNRPELRTAVEKMEQGEFSRRLPPSDFRKRFERRLQEYAKYILAKG
ncbi:MAG: hypothetical protein ACI8X5_001877 [Planctomycetota bacterium]|jgi:hypothetical protein